MRTRARIPALEPTVMDPPAVCPYPGCQGRHFKDHQLHCEKPLRDTRLDQVVVRRRKCLSCGRTHRVYPRGVGHARQSEPLKGLSILFYVLGMSYRGVEGTLESFGYSLDHTSIYRNVRAAGEPVQRLRRMWLEQIHGETLVAGNGVTDLQRRGDQVAVAVAVNGRGGVTLDIQAPDNAEAETLQGWLGPLLELVGADPVS